MQVSVTLIKRKQAYFFELLCNHQQLKMVKIKHKEVIKTVISSQGYTPVHVHFYI